jgi:hypothetical protein
MSFNWATNSWQGPGNVSNNVTVGSPFYLPSGMHRVVSQAAAHSAYYQIPDYLLLKDLAADKTPLTSQRGGYSGENPARQDPIKLKCNMEQSSSKYYCDGKVTSLSY